MGTIRRRVKPARSGAGKMSEKIKVREFREKAFSQRENGDFLSLESYREEKFPCMHSITLNING
jgi:hypothetical protein